MENTKERQVKDVENLSCLWRKYKKQTGERDYL
jgi:hypothetical protein